MSLEEFITDWHSDSPTVLVHTSGSTGSPKPMLVEKRRMEASARMTCRFLGLKRGDTALLCMPLDFIAGKMMAVRALTCGLKLVSVPPGGHPLSLETHADEQSSQASRLSSRTTLDLVAMVPMQVYNTLQVPEERERLMRVRHLLIGGGAVDSSMEAQLRSFPNAVWSTYGMTETLSHIALRRLNGPDATGWYTPMQGVSVTVNDEGCLVIDAPAVHEGLLVTNDIAETSGGRFRIVGRKDNVICSGGLKIHVEQVEQTLHNHTDLPLLVSKRQDEKYGQAVTLLAMPQHMAALKQLCNRVLPRYWKPRYYVAVQQLPMTATGKPARSEAEAMANVKTFATAGNPYGLWRETTV